jgi:hypothetical protein
MVLVGMMWQEQRDSPRLLLCSGCDVAIICAALPSTPNRMLSAVGSRQSAPDVLYDRSERERTRENKQCRFESPPENSTA